MMLRHIPFLKNVFLYSITAFGGPQAHIAMMMKMFVDRTPYITKDELLEYNAFCNLLPGASSTQTVTLIGYKRGGISLAVITLLVWIAPACLLMGSFSFLLEMLEGKPLHTELFRYIPAMAVGFLVYASINTFRLSVHNTITWVIMIIALSATFYFFRSPWIFPLCIVAGGVATNFSKKRIPQVERKPRKVKWGNIWLFASIFIILGALSETARKHDWPDRKPINLVENTYRMGSLVFGGGQVLMPMMYEQFSVRPANLRNAQSVNTSNMIEIDKEDMTTAMGIVRAMPGPVFSIASFTGGMALKEEGKTMQVIGCILGSVAIFLPSALLVLFFFPIWSNLKKYAAVYRSLEGINAAVVGIMIASTLFIMKDISMFPFEQTGVINLGVIGLTALLLLYTRIPSPVIVALCLLLSYAGL